jgi:hypothetical protein
VHHKIIAYLDLSFHADKIRALPEDSEDTMARLRKGLDQCSSIPGLVEMHFVHGRDAEAFSAIAKVEVEDITAVGNVINEVKKIFPLKTLTTLLAKPQAAPGQRVSNESFL